MSRQRTIVVEYRRPRMSGRSWPSASLQDIDRIQAPAEKTSPAPGIFSHLPEEEVRALMAEAEERFGDAAAEPAHRRSQAIAREGRELLRLPGAIRSSTHTGGASRPDAVEPSKGGDLADTPAADTPAHTISTRAPSAAALVDLLRLSAEIDEAWKILLAERQSYAMRMARCNAIMQRMSAH